MNENESKSPSALPEAEEVGRTRVTPPRNTPQILAEFERLSVADSKVAAVMRTLDSVEREACRQWFVLGYLEGQCDSLRFHNEQMERGKQIEASRAKS